MYIWLRIITKDNYNILLIHWVVAVSEIDTAVVPENHSYILHVQNLSSVKPNSPCISFAMIP